MSKTVLTPADLDLKVKDRKPDVVPKVGDLVKIKSRKWYEKWMSSYYCVNLPGILFTSQMSDHCGCFRTISSDFNGIFKLKEDTFNFDWSPECFENVIPLNRVSAETTAPSIDTVSTIDNILSGSISVSDFPTISHLSGFGKNPKQKPSQLKTIKRKRFIKIKNL